MLGLAYQQIAKNLCVDSSTAWRAIEKFNAEGTVATKYNKGPQTLTGYEKFVIMETVLEKSAAYLHEVCTDLLVKTGTTISESAICRFLQHNNFFMKKNCILLLSSVMKSCDHHLFLIVKFILRR